MSFKSPPKTLKEKLGGRNIFLIGMMGSGKSQTGPVLAKMINYAFVDTDDVIEKATKQSINTIFQKEGEKEFRKLEKKILTEISQYHSLVIATGGGVVTLKENWGSLHQGIVIWLDLDINHAIQRLKDDEQKRPLLNDNDWIKTFKDIYEQRKPLYMEADLRIVIEDQSAEEVANMIAKGLLEIICDQDAST